jgi:uncharacterized protein
MNSLKHTAMICLTILGLSYFLKSGLENFNRDERSISVKGLSEKEVDSNLAIWKINFNVSSDRSEVIQQSLPVVQDKIQKFLIEKGFTVEEISKGSSIKDRQAQDYGGEKGNRFVATGYYIVNSTKVTQVEKAEQEVDELLKKGVVITENEVNYHFTDLNSIKPLMLDEATKNAKEAANGFAKSMDVAVGKLKSATQGVFSIESPTQSGEYSNGEKNSSIKKKVRVVTQVVFYIK